MTRRPTDATPPPRSPATGEAEISVVIPARNEEDNIGPLLVEIRGALDGVFAYEVIVVDDGSRDATPERLAQARREDGRLRVLRHREAAGQSMAILSGVKAARAALVATLDGDGQNDPADIRKLIEIARGAGAPDRPLMVCGHRRRRADSWLKRLSSRVANAVRGRLLGDRIPDTGCGLKVFPRDAFLELPRFDHMHRFLPALMLAAGGEVVSVEVSHRARRRGRTNYGVFDRLGVGIVDLLGVAWLMRRSRRPVVENKDG
jgi:dolichol-phosphate mannosyltransferase